MYIELAAQNLKFLLEYSYYPYQTRAKKQLCQDALTPRQPISVCINISKCEGKHLLTF